VILENTNVSQARPRGTGERGTAQKPRSRGKRTSTRDRVRPTCEDCNKDFFRVQELERHLKDVHTPRRECPFCDFMWTRPDKIKPHIVAKHQDIFSPEMLANIQSMFGKQIVAFVDGFITDPYGEFEASAWKKHSIRQSRRGGLPVLM
jgi:hypothetical protein